MRAHRHTHKHPPGPPNPSSCRAVKAFALPLLCPGLSALPQAPPCRAGLDPLRAPTCSCDARGARRAPSPTQGSPLAPGGHRGLPPWGNSWGGGSHEPWSSQGPSLAPPYIPPLCREVSACGSGTRQGREGTPTWGPRQHPLILPCQHPPQHTAPPAVGAGSRPQPPPRSSAAVMFRLEDNVLEIIALIKKG